MVAAQPARDLRRNFGDQDVPERQCVDNASLFPKATYGGVAQLVRAAES
jgi:hypothetical protein